MRCRNFRFCVLVCMFVMVAQGCSLITEFEDYKDGGDSRLYSLEENVADPVSVILKNPKDAQITLLLEKTLPGSDDDDTLTIEQLLQNVVTLTLKNLNSDATVNLTRGTYVAGEPGNPGEFRINITPERDSIVVQFYNQLQDGRSLNESGDYEAALEIRENEHLVAESIVRDVVVIRQ